MTDTSEQHRHRCEVRFLIRAARERDASNEVLQETLTRLKVGL